MLIIIWRGPKIWRGIGRSLNMPTPGHMLESKAKKSFDRGLRYRKSETICVGQIGKEKPWRTEITKQNSFWT